MMLNQIVPVVVSEENLYHHVVAISGIYALHIVFHMSTSWSDPGIATTHNLTNYIFRFGYDGKIYESGELCDECHVPRLPRARHCCEFDHSFSRYSSCSCRSSIYHHILSDMLKACIFKYSHFCLLTNNAIGHLNHFRFLLFLASFLLTAATVVTYSGLALNFYVEKRNLWDAFVKVSPRRVERMNWTVLCQVCITVFLADQFLIVYFNYRSIIIVCPDFASRLSN